MKQRAIWWNCFFHLSDIRIQIKKLRTRTTATAGLLHCYASTGAAALSPFALAIRWRRWSAIEARFSAINSVERVSHLYAQYPTKPNTPIEMKCAPGSAIHRGEQFVKKHGEDYILSSKLRFCIPNWPMRTARPKAENPRMFASSDMLLWRVGSSRNRRWWLAKHGMWASRSKSLAQPQHFVPLIYSTWTCCPRFHNMATDPVADAASKINEAKKKKETGDQAFKTGNLKDGKRVLYSIMNAHS